MSRYTNIQASRALISDIVAETADTDWSPLGGARRLPVKTADTDNIRLRGSCRLPVKTADTGKVRLGGACRLPLRDY